MPELPEVECLTQAVSGIILNQRVDSLTFLRKDLRYPIPVKSLKKILEGNEIISVTRRSKYMLWQTKNGHALIHLGMTGNVLQMDSDQAQFPHTHVIFSFRGTSKSKNFHLHYVDPRRFGQIDGHLGESVENHPAIRNLGVEPLIKPSELADHLFQKSIARKTPIKNFIMNAEVVVGVGNIYASESLYSARIHPLTHAGKLSKGGSLKLSRSIQKTLRSAIASGGTSFRDFKNSNGSPGYFEQKLKVYGRKNQPCKSCASLIKVEKIGGRSTFFCPKCQLKNT